MHLIDGEYDAVVWMKATNRQNFILDSGILLSLGTAYNRFGDAAISCKMFNGTDWKKTFWKSEDADDFTVLVLLTLVNALRKHCRLQNL